ncbi:MAG: RibD family protein [Cyanobium sp.]
MLAASLDGRLAPPDGGAAQIGGRGDRRVLEEALAWADAALLGAETLRRHGSTCLIHASDLLAARREQGRPPQPLALVASRSGRIPMDLPFFRQPLERWLLWMQVCRGDQAKAGPATVAAEPRAAGLQGWQLSAGTREGGCADFTQVLNPADWADALRQLAAAGVQRLVVLGGAALASDLLAEHRIDELQLTLCPHLLGGEHTWLQASALMAPPAGSGAWMLLEHRRLEGEELLLRYGRPPRLP